MGCGGFFDTVRLTFFPTLMTRREQRSFCYSAAAHVAVLFGCGIAALLTNCTDEEPEVHVFQLAAAAPPPPAAAPQPPSPAPTPPPPQAEPPTPPPTPKPPKPTPKPPKPKPPEHKPKKVTPKPTPKPPPPKPRAVSFDEFRKKHKIPKNTPKPTPRPPAPAPRPPKIQLNPSDFALPKIELQNQPSPSATISPDAINRYLAQVQARLQATWQRLLSQANLTLGGQASVQFRVSSTGVILSPRIGRSSGNPALDNLAMQVFRQVGNVGSPPGGALDSSLAQVFRVN